MKPLKTEINTIAELLKEGAETPEDLAAAVIEAVDKARATRVTYSAILRFGGDGTAFFQSYGPFATKNQAVKAIEKHPAAGMATAFAVVPQANQQGMAELLERIDTPAPVKGDWVQVRKDAADVRAGRKLSR